MILCVAQWWKFYIVSEKAQLKFKRKWEKDRKRRKKGSPFLSCLTSEREKINCYLRNLLLKCRLHTCACLCSGSAYMLSPGCRCYPRRSTCGPWMSECQLACAHEKKWTRDRGRKHTNPNQKQLVYHEESRRTLFSAHPALSWPPRLIFEIK